MSEIREEINVINFKILLKNSILSRYMAVQGKGPRAGSCLFFYHLLQRASVTVNAPILGGFE